MEDTILVFVYGTLKSGGMLAGGLDSDRRSCRSATARGLLYHNHYYPFMMESSAMCDVVHGEVHEYPVYVLRRLDLIEGYNEDFPDCGIGYARREIEAFICEGERETVKAYAYLWQKKVNHSDQLLVNGIWQDKLSITFDSSTIENDIPF